MTNLLKWIYTLGIQHERRRVKLLIEKHSMSKPEKPPENSIYSLEEYNRDLNVWYKTQDALGAITRPQYKVRETAVSPLDEELS